MHDVIPLQIDHLLSGGNVTHVCPYFMSTKIIPLKLWYVFIYIMHEKETRLIINKKFPGMV